MTESDVAYGAKFKYTEVKARDANRDARRNIPELRLLLAPSS